MAKKKKSSAVVIDDIGSVHADAFNVRMFFDDALDMIEKKTKISSRSMAMRGTRLSTGILALDMYLGGGLVPGSWTTVAGGEQSCKSTFTMTVLAQVIKTAFSGVANIFDFEGSSDANYIANMLATAGLKTDPKTIFGVPDPDNGGWIIPPTVRYYAPDNGEAFFDFMSMSRRRLPDKIIDDKGIPWLIFENTKENKKIVGDKYDKKWFSKRNQYRVRAADSEMQMLTIVDSYPAMLPDQVDDDDGSKAMALQARMFSDGIKRFRGGMRRKMMTILGINQLRQRPATMFGDPAYEPCGDALKFYCFAEDTRLVTDHGRLTAPEIAALIAQGTRILVETAFGMQPILNAWQVDEERDQARVYAGGYAYTGSTKHRQLVLKDRKVAGVGTVRDAHWVTLADVIEDPQSVKYSVLRMPEGKRSIPFTNDRELRDELASRLRTGYTQLQQGDSNRVNCSYLPADTGWYEDYLQSHGIFSYLDTRGSMRTIPGLTDEQVLDIIDTDWDSSVRDAQCSAMLSMALVDVYPQLVTFCLGKGIRLNDEESIIGALDDLLADEREDSHFYEHYDLMHTQAAYIEEILTYCDFPALLPMRVTAVPESERVPLWDVTVPTTGTVITNRFVSHNSDVRIRLVSRAVPEGWPKMKDRPGSVSEPSVTVEGGIDVYRFIAAKTIKNKMGGIPNQQTWLRLWEADGNGEARGFDPVYDTFYFMKTVGLISGPRKKMKFAKPCPLAGGKAIDWDDFRTLILGTQKQVTEVCKEMGVKAGDLRKWCFKYLNSDAGKQAIKDSIVKGAKAAKEDDSDD